MAKRNRRVIRVASTQRLNIDAENMISGASQSLAFVLNDLHQIASSLGGGGGIAALAIAGVAARVRKIKDELQAVLAGKAGPLGLILDEANMMDPRILAKINTRIDRKGDSR